jgi:hypothetical protein
MSRLVTSPSIVAEAAASDRRTRDPRYSLHHRAGRASGCGRRASVRPACPRPGSCESRGCHSARAARTVCTIIPRVEIWTMLAAWSRAINSPFNARMRSTRGAMRRSWPHFDSNSLTTATPPQVGGTPQLSSLAAGVNSGGAYRTSAWTTVRTLRWKSSTCGPSRLLIYTLESPFSVWWRSYLITSNCS